MKEPFKDRLKEAMRLRKMKQADLANATGLGKSAISQYCSGVYEPKQTPIFLIAKTLNVSEAWLMGFDVPMDRTENHDNILKIETKKFPMLGTIAAGSPILAEEQFDSYVEAGTNIHADFCLKVRGDSMINARICDGDIVFIKKQSDVQNGQIAAVVIDDEATLKRVFKNDNEVILVAENSSYSPMIYSKNGAYNIRIIGKAVAFQSDVR
jgi:repressor LexA